MNDQPITTVAQALAYARQLLAQVQGAAEHIRIVVGK